MSPNQNYYIFT